MAFSDEFYDDYGPLYRRYSPVSCANPTSSLVPSRARVPEAAWPRSRLEWDPERHCPLPAGTVEISPAPRQVHSGTSLNGHGVSPVGLGTAVDRAGIVHTSLHFVQAQRNSTWGWGD
ncbi:unnamed protein product [Protopolystoma xenopodis]|uniref:Uncharacterized protein n=1 Tax=Protopolystoma xenopodis TaxID=117903 RepID=A0A448WTH2_9PLAT|nr:unnamed protein product [Protopolystoma xenopodis]